MFRSLFKYSLENRIKFDNNASILLLRDVFVALFVLRVFVRRAERSLIILRSVSLNDQGALLSSMRAFQSIRGKNTHWKGFSPPVFLI